MTFTLNLTDFKKGSGLISQTLTSAPHERPSNQTLTKNPQKLCYFSCLPLTTNPQLDWQTLKNFDYPKLKDPTWSASLRGVLGSVTLIIFVLEKKSTFWCNFLHFISKIFRIIRNKLPFPFLRPLIYSPCSIRYFRTNDNSLIGCR